MGGSNIWIYLELSDGQIEDVSLEILGEARKHADKHGHHITAVMLGSDPSDLGNNAIGYGADSVLFLRNKKLNEYGTELFTKALSETAGKKKPDSILIGATRNGRDLAARTAARLRTGLAANVVTLSIDEDGTVHSGVPGYGSKVIADILCVNNKPQMSTVRQGLFQKRSFDPERKGKVDIVDVNLDGTKNAVSVMTRITKESKDISNSEKVIVAGNGSDGNSDLVVQLADALHADIGATRPLVDRGLYPRDLQVGSTGVSLKADWTMILGSSGSEHFVTGIANCKKVISIDINPKSDIFDYSDYCIVGDVSKLIPRLIKKLEVAHQ